MRELLESPLRGAFGTGAWTALSAATLALSCLLAVYGARLPDGLETSLRSAQVASSASP